MAQHDINDIAATIVAAGREDALLAIGGVEKDRWGDYVAWNVRALSAVHQLADKVKSATTVATVVASGHAVYTKHRGQWIISGDPTVITPGATVTVSRRDGSTSDVIVDQIVGTSTTRGTLATFTPADRHVRPATRSGRCAQCDRHSDHLRQVADSSGILGHCCYRCVGMDAVERSFA